MIQSTSDPGGPGLRLHNTLSRQVEEFAPRDDKVLMYVCGITPYSESHLGHAMSYIIFDIAAPLPRVPRLQVKHVQNYTDIDDKLIARAEREGRRWPRSPSATSPSSSATSPSSTSSRPTSTRAPREEVPSIVEMIEGLIDKGFAYQGPQRDGSRDVYYRVEKKDDYGKLSKRSLESMLSGARIEPLEGKENPMDFTLWKGAKPGEPVLGQPLGPRTPRLAHRVLRDVAAPPRRRRSTSTAAASTSSSPTTRTRSPRPRRSPASGPSRASGCTTASCRWAKRR